MKRLVSILLSLILLVTHVSLTIGIHYCGGEAVMSKLMMAETNLDCGMTNMDDTCDDSENHGLSYTNPPCCENHFHTFQASDDFIKDTSQVNLNIDFEATLVYSILNEDLSPKSAHQFYADYSPPPLEKDIQILFQTFLI